MIKLFLKLAVLGLLANATWHVFSAYLAQYRFRDGVEYAAKYRATSSDDELREKILELATQLDVPVAPEAISLKSTNLHTEIDASYTRVVELMPGVTYPWPFVFHADIFTIQAPIPNSRTPK